MVEPERCSFENVCFSMAIASSGDYQPSILRGRPIKRGFCPSCGARRMAESARHLVEGMFGARPVRQWVLSIPYPLRFLFANRPPVINAATGYASTRRGCGWVAEPMGRVVHSNPSAKMTSLTVERSHS